MKKRHQVRAQHTRREQRQQLYIRPEDLPIWKRAKMMCKAVGTPLSRQITALLKEYYNVKT